MNTLQELINITQPKTRYRIGRIISHTGSFCVVEDNTGGIHKVSGVGYSSGQYVLSENDMIIGRVTEKIKRVFIS